MLIDRLPNGALLFQVRWSTFIADWKVATPAQRCVLDDGRPAIRREPEEDDRDGITYTTLPHELWRLIRARQKEAFALNPPAPRTRLCQSCRSEMKLAREYEDCWTFVCPACTSREVWGKDQPGIGGTRGAGEREKK